jgi:phage shock protein E
MSIDPVTAAVVAVAGFLIVRRLLKGGQVSKDVVLEKIKAGAQIVDVRTPEEFRGGAYPDAVNIPLNDLERRLGELEKDRAVVLYCASGGRSGLATQLLKRAGFADVVNAGGLMDLLK